MNSVTWWQDLTAEEQEDVRAYVTLLQEDGPQLKFPYSSGIKQAAHNHMRELRVQHGGRPYRVLYAFDPRRTAMLLIGGDKTGDDRWYDVFVPIADRLYDEHIAQLKRERDDTQTTPKVADSTQTFLSSRAAARAGIAEAQRKRWAGKRQRDQARKEPPKGKKDG